MQRLTAFLCTSPDCLRPSMIWFQPNFQPWSLPTLPTLNPHDPGNTQDSGLPSFALCWTFNSYPSIQFCTCFEVEVKFYLPLEYVPDCPAFSDQSPVLFITQLNTVSCCLHWVAVSLNCPISSLANEGFRWVTCKVLCSSNSLGFCVCLSYLLVWIANSSKAGTISFLSVTPSIFSPHAWSWVGIS